VDNPRIHEEKVVTKAFLLIIKTISINYWTIGEGVMDSPTLTLGNGIT
jgi:hypothetical protein